MQEREILFRGKRLDNGEWVEGYLLQSNLIVPAGQFFNFCRCNGKNIITRDSYLLFYEVFPETRGEYTGLTDKNGVKIFEGDILKIYPDCDYLEDFDISKVYSYNGVLCVNYHTSEYDATAIGFAYDIDETEFEVIGNIHDNPELLEVK